MKKYSIFFLLAAFALTACSKSEEPAPADEMVRVEGLEISVGGMTVSGEAQTRSVDDFAVNTANDPTHTPTMAGRLDWKFDLQIYKSGTPFTPFGAASMAWNAGLSQWIPATVLYFPNYTRQRVTADLYPVTKTTLPAAIQNTEALLLAQDILVLNDPNYRTNPAHIVQNIPVHHKYSMLDIILREVNDQQIASIEVVAGGTTYTPLKIQKVNGFTKTEYLLILPVGVTNPVINLRTVEGARYTETLEITTAENVCFCVNLLGLELKLGGITISNWTYGSALSGEYSVVTSYPTFKGTPNTTVTLTFDNGLTQQLSFNSRGEATVKPAGRTITQINGNVQNPPIVLRSMMIDLNPYLT